MGITVGERRILDDEDWKATIADLHDLFKNYSEVSSDFYVARAITLVTSHYERRGMIATPSNKKEQS